MKRIYRDPPDNERCEAMSYVPRGEHGRCGRRKKIGPYCLQHHKQAEERVRKLREYLAEKRI